MIAHRPPRRTLDMVTLDAAAVAETERRHRSPATPRAYLGDARAQASWCSSAGVDPLAASGDDMARWRADCRPERIRAAATAVADALPAS